MTPPIIRSITFDEILERIGNSKRSPIWSSSASLAERVISLEGDDAALFEDFFAAFGGSDPEERPAPSDSFLTATIRTADGSEFGCMWLRRNGRPFPVDEVFFGLSFPDCPYRSAPSDDARWMQVWLAADDVPRFAYRDDVCLFRKAADWRSKLMSVIYRGSLRLREDLIFFHASALSIAGRGVLIVGRKKAGKSTTSLALAGRGHSILADSCACYAPATGELVPFRRPVGIREGPRSRMVDAALAGNTLRSVERDESLRVDVETLLSLGPPRAVPASAIFFLQGFADATRIEKLKNDQSEIGNLRPIYSSFANAPHTQRVFELIQLLSRARLYALWPGEPDHTACSIEEVIA
ncbi:MAG: hypothetical protein M3041_12695 [Acidobacteriota bacterium]|nr:hypothetical protein [Acidobacteriota bacterium]